MATAARRASRLKTHIHYRRNYRKKKYRKLTHSFRGIRAQTAEDTLTSSSTESSRSVEVKVSEKKRKCASERSEQKNVNMKESEKKEARGRGGRSESVRE